MIGSSEPLPSEHTPISPPRPEHTPTATIGAAWVGVGARRLGCLQFTLRATQTQSVSECGVESRPSSAAPGSVRDR